jgi:hypothetical protein
VTGWAGTEPAGTVFFFRQLHMEDAMSLPKLLATAAVLSVIGAPAMAQQVISEPGYCAFFYPNANCQNKGPNNPYTGDYQRNLAAQQQGMWAGGQTVGVAAPKPRPHRATTRMQ